MSLVVALLAYGYICFDGYGVYRRVRSLGDPESLVRWCWTHDRAWMVCTYSLDVVLMGTAVYLAIRHTLG